MSSTEIILVIIIGILSIIFICALLIINKNIKNIKVEDKSDQITKDIQIQLSKLLNDNNTNVTSIVNGFSSSVNSTMNSKFTENNKVLADINNSLGGIKENQKTIDKLNEQVNNLNSILGNNQSRGRFGEEKLENLLKEILGDIHGLYDFQKEIKIGVKPDSCVLMGDKKYLCIDSKFSFNSYAKLFDNNNNEDKSHLQSEFKNELKKQITSIGDKYIINGLTVDYAMMFVPSDGVYLYLQNDDDMYESIVKYARQKKVFLVSPTLLEPILINIKTLYCAVQTTKHITDIINNISKLTKTNESFKKSWDDLIKAQENLIKKENDVDSQVNKIYKKIDDITSKGIKDGLITSEGEDDE